MFLDTIKYFQQSLASPANSLTDNEKELIQKGCKIFNSKHKQLLRKFKKCAENDQEWIINYLFSSKGVVTYEMITTFDSLNILPEKGEFFFAPFSFGS